MSLVELGRFPRNEAHIIVGRLDAEGIDAITFDGGASIADGSWLLIPVRVMVDADDLAAAERASLPNKRAERCHCPKSYRIVTIAASALHCNTGRRHLACCLR